MLNNPIEYERMAMVEGNHWWYRVLHQRVMGVLKNSPPNVGGVPRSGEGVLSGLSILDAGCGT
jgi:2-polyprenyl-3-methyl-5-hydroxy-6-metoxy-1,4-benzoquinol methylase